MRDEMNRYNPDITIITPTLNSGKYISKCIDSIRQQHGVVVEHIIVDGGSVDDTLLISQESGARVILLNGSSIYQALNYGVKIAGSNYVGFLNSDDYYHSSTSLSDVVKSFNLNPHYKIIYGNCRFVNSFGVELYRLISPPMVDYFFARMRYFNVSHPSWFISKSAFNDMGGYDEKLRYISDCDFLLRALRSGVLFKYVNTAFASFTLHSFNTSSSISARMEMRRSFSELNGNSVLFLIFHYLLLINMFMGDPRYFKFRLLKLFKRLLDSSS